MDKPPRHSVPRIKAASHAQQVYDRQTRRMTAGLREAADLRNSSFWRKVRLTYLSRNPMCANPHGYHSEFAPPAREVHHVVSLQEAPHLAYNHSNLMALCSRCHARYSAEERRA